MNTLTYSAALKFDSRKAAREFRRMVEPQTKPYNLKHPKRKRAWRIIKKWFNRYERPEIQRNHRTVIMRSQNGDTINGIITDVRISKSTLGGHRQDRSYTVKPLPK